MKETCLIAQFPVEGTGFGSADNCRDGQSVVNPIEDNESNWWDEMQERIVYTVKKFKTKEDAEAYLEVDCASSESINTYDEQSFNHELNDKADCFFRECDESTEDVYERLRSTKALLDFCFILERQGAYYASREDLWWNLNPEIDKESDDVREELFKAFDVLSIVQRARMNNKKGKKNTPQKEKNTVYGFPFSNSDSRYHVVVRKFTDAADAFKELSLYRGVLNVATDEDFFFYLSSNAALMFKEMIVSGHLTEEEFDKVLRSHPVAFGFSFFLYSEELGAYYTSRLEDGEIDENDTDTPILQEEICRGLCIDGHKMVDIARDLYKEL